MSEGKALKPIEPGDPETLRDGRYELEGILGEGAMGRTYAAHDTQSGGRVAIKQLYPSRLATLKDLELFHREAQVLRTLDHDRIPSYLDSFSSGEGEAACYFLVQGLVDGSVLRDELNGGRRWSEAEVIEFAIALVELLEYMHSQQPVVVHRDIKPDNIILRASDGMPTLVDFGAVREVVRLTMGGGSTVIGSYGYMPPEQLMGRALPGSDLYSTGITVLELLTRQTPQDLHGDDARRLIAEANISEDLRRFLRRMCEPKLSDRYATAADALDDLRSLSGGGALVNAARLEGAVAEREVAANKALKKRSGVDLFTLVSIVFISGGLIAGVAFLAVILGKSLVGAGAPLLAGGAISGAGLLIALVLLARRYTHDAWEPPNHKWTRTTATVEQVSNALIATRRGMVSGFEVKYSFPAGNRRFEATRGYESREKVEFAQGDRIPCYYRPGNPEAHELHDRHNDPMDAMQQLFSPFVEHTPE